MKAYLKSIVSLLLACLFLGVFLLQIYATSAEELIEPYYQVTKVYSADFGIMNGVASIIVKYSGRTSTFLRADITVKIQKRILGLYWRDVDIGYSNNVWTDSSIFLQDTFAQSFSVDGTGYYRALITVKIYGTTGEVDTIEVTKECEYN